MSRSLCGGYGRTALICVALWLTGCVLSGCGGSGGVPIPPGPGSPPNPPPWALSMYESGKTSPSAEGTLTRSGDQYVIELARDGSETETSTVGIRDVVREGDAVSIPMPATQSRQETFGRTDLARALRALDDGCQVGIRSADEERIYLIRPAKVHEVRPE